MPQAAPRLLRHAVFAWPGHGARLSTSPGAPTHHILLQQELYARIPEDVPLYNLRDVVPEIYQPRWVGAQQQPPACPALLQLGCAVSTC